MVFVRRLLLLLILLPSLSHAQGVSHTNIALYNSAGTARVVPSALVTVCTANAVLIPCTPTVSIFKDFLLSNPLANPFNADANGNYSFMVAPGNYTVTITGIGIVGYSYQISLVGPSVGTPNTWTALQSFPNGINTSSIVMNGGTITRSDAASFLISAASGQDVGFVATGGGSIRLTNLNFISGATGRVTQYMGVNTFGNGISATYFTDDQTAVVATRGPVTVLTGGSTTGGHWILCYDEEVTTSDASGRTITFTSNFTSNGVARVFTGSVIAVASTANSERNCVAMNVDNSVNVTYTITASGAFATAQYAINVWMKKE